MFILNVSISFGQHLGEWAGTSAGVTNNLVLDSTNHAIFIIDEIEFGGEHVKFEGKEADFKYEIDYSKNPVWFDFVFYDKEKGEQITRWKGIMRFLNNSKMEHRVSFNPDTERFESFDPNDQVNTIIWDKIID